MNNLFKYIAENINSPNIKIEKLNYDHDTIKELLDLKWPLFKEAYEGEKLRHHKYFVGQFNDDTVNNSIVARDTKTGKLVGAYIITEVEFEADKKLDLYDLSKLNGKTCYEGISLFVDKQYQGYGVGKKLINYLIELSNKNNTPILGSHFYSLHNIQDWLKRRYLYRDDTEDRTYYTIATNVKLKPSKIGKKYFKLHPEFFK